MFYSDPVPIMLVERLNHLKTLDKFIGVIFFYSVADPDPARFLIGHGSGLVI